MARATIMWPNIWSASIGRSPAPTWWSAGPVPARPAVYVPLPIGNGEQRFNAEPVVRSGGGLMVPDREFTKEWVVYHIPGLLADHGTLEGYAEAAWRYGIRDAAETMAARVLEMID